MNLSKQNVENIKINDDGTVSVIVLVELALNNVFKLEMLLEKDKMPQFTQISREMDSLDAWMERIGFEEKDTVNFHPEDSVIETNYLENFRKRANIIF